MFTHAQALGKAAEWKKLSSEGGYYSQTGTDPNFPTFSTGRGETYAAGSDFPPQKFEYDYVSPEYLAGNFNYEIAKPHIPGGQDFTGVPNATPEMLERLRLRKSPNLQGGQELPSFLKPI
jgi:hypothetical protein